MLAKYIKYFVNLSSLLVFFFVFKGCNKPSKHVQNAPDVSLRFCIECKPLKDVRNFENKMQSNLLLLSNFQANKFVTNKLYPIEKNESPLSAIQYREVFKRESLISPFNEYILYWYELFDKGEHYIVDNDTLFSGYFMIEFNCGTEPFGYDTVNVREHLNWMGKFRAFTPVRKVPLDSFKLGYYSILKWLYAQETDWYKVKREKYEQFNYDYYGNPAVKKENLVLEDPWQEEFLFNAYKLVDTQSERSFDDVILIVRPYTLAPMHLYEVLPPRSPDYDKFMYRTKKYHINVADMAIRVYKFPAHDEE